MIKLTLLERRLRISTGLILASYILLHLSNHILGLISLDLMESVRQLVTTFWRSWMGAVLIYGSILTHFTLALISLYRRTTLIMPPWELTQLVLGLSIIPLLAGHIAATMGSRVLMDLEVDYEFILSAMLSDNWLTLRQFLLLVVAWSHACMGLHFCFRLGAWYRHHLLYFYPLIVLIPLLVVLSVSRVGVELDVWGAQPASEYGDDYGYGISDSRSSEYTYDISKDADGYDGGYGYDKSGGYSSDGPVSGYKEFQSEDLRKTILAIYWGLLAAVLLARWIRGQRQANGAIQIQHPSGRRVQGRDGQSILEMLRQNRIHHASVCGGRGRCTTCRIRIDHGLEQLHEPGKLEQEALQRIAAAPNVRLACQSRPHGTVKITPLLPPDLILGRHSQQGGINGEERQILAMFVDLRDSTRLGEQRLPYDVLFILNRFFLEMSESLKESHGHYAQFAGDGLMALYGLERGLKQGCLDALRGAVDMQQRIHRLNEELKNELTEPLRIGIGLHCGEAIVGTMGPPSSPNYSAIGDNINAAARLESQTKLLGCTLVVSERVAEASELDLNRFPKQQVSLKGKDEQLWVYAISDTAALESLFNGP